MTKAKSKKLKYMGSAHIRTIPKGTDFGGQLADPIESDLVFNADNFWVVDAKDAGLSDEAVELLLEGDTFKDVSDMKRIPPNRHQSLFMGMKSVSDEEIELVTTAESSISEGTTTTGGSTTSGGSTPSQAS